MSTLENVVPAGVVVGDDVQKLFAYAKERGFALPAANCTGTNSVNAALETAREMNGPMVIQFSNGGGAPSPEPMPAPCTFISWRNSTGCASYCTPITALRSCCPGLTDCWMPAR